MRTRKSWRNQERMFKYLTPKNEPKKEVEIKPRCGNCIYISSSRNYSNCKLKKIKVYSQSICVNHKLK